MHVEPRVVHDLPFNTYSNFNRAHRLLRKDGFNHVLDARNVYDKYFKIFYVFNQKLNARLGIIVSKKFQPSAVKRNYLKRVIRNVFRTHNVKRLNLDLVILQKQVNYVDIDLQIMHLNILLTRVEKNCVNS